MKNGPYILVVGRRCDGITSSFWSGRDQVRVLHPERRRLPVVQSPVVRVQVRDAGAAEGRRNLRSQLAVDEHRRDGQAPAGEGEAGHCVQETQVLQHRRHEHLAPSRARKARQQHNAGLSLSVMM